MFIFRGKTYTGFGINEDGNVVLSKEEDGVTYELELSVIDELENITIQNQLSVTGMETMYKELDMIEETVHELYKRYT